MNRLQETTDGGQNARGESLLTWALVVEMPEERALLTWALVVEMPEERAYSPEL